MPAAANVDARDPDGAAAQGVAARGTRAPRARGPSAALVAVSLLLPTLWALAGSSMATPLPEPHPSITIVGDAGFLSPLAGVRAGSGTSNDPYVISDWAIAKTADHGILLQDTTAHVVVERVVMDGPEGALTRVLSPGCLEDGICGTAGVRLLNAQNVTLRHVRVSSAGVALEIHQSRDVRVEVASLGPLVDAPGATVGQGVLVQESLRVDLSNVSSVAPFPFSVRAVTDVGVRDSSFRWPPSAAFPAPPGASPLAQVKDGTRVTLERVLLQEVPLLLDGRTEDVSVLESRFVVGSQGGVQVRLDPATRVERLLVCGSLFEGGAAAPALDVSLAGEVVVRGSGFVGNGHGARIAADQILFERNLVADASGRGLAVRGAGAQVHNNSFEGNADGVAVSTPPGATEPADVRLNWWGDASGPSGQGPGSGDPLATLGDVLFDPWLQAPPALGVDCGVPRGAAGVQRSVDVPV